MEIARNRYLKMLEDRIGNGSVKVITGLRRSGKSYLLFRIFRDRLLEHGVSPDDIVTAQLDDISQDRLREPHALYDYVRSSAEGRQRCFVFLDEIQYVDRFAEVVNGLMRLPGLDLYVTGSNSRFLSSDVLTEFRGRGDEIRVAPLSFSEYLPAHGGDRRDAWRDYVTYGGMPLVLSRKGHAAKASYLRTLFDKVYISDICEHNGIRDSAELGSLVDVLASSVGSLTNPHRLENTFRSELGSELSDKTIRSYIGYLEDAFLVERADRYDVKGRRYISTPSKYYFTDVGLRNARLNFRQQEENHLMENVLYNELLYRGWSVDVGVVDGGRAPDGGRRRLEVDFVANRGDRRCYVQSAFTTRDPDKREQEKGSLTRIDDSFEKVIVTGDDVNPWYDEDGVLTVGLLDFLLDDGYLG